MHEKPFGLRPAKYIEKERVPGGNGLRGRPKRPGQAGRKGVHPQIVEPVAGQDEVFSGTVQGRGYNLELLHGWTKQYLKGLREDFSLLFIPMVNGPEFLIREIGRHDFFSAYGSGFQEHFQFRFGGRFQDPIQK